ncbi:uncharacterized protein K489DRAFT_367646 [Dissoconium aciculare CBS 342.82]|uniref:Uncharacterized protein n=1 Tax=Dissoconium aciculare CBS 342.82 TaxID=1314786 RepID=A0A6J3MEK4_9PEZI|nr:uncharacterized protein K489DRAFT_367646 [Dissoconium aciculare CBS 342.82]KAF1826436.1 hypothetical protein K489DRAFT_367646 [Dissoconium aciculare CBS 342.82]
MARMPAVRWIAIHWARSSSPSSLPPVPAPAAQERAWAGLLLLEWCPPAPSGNCNVMMIAHTVDVDFWCTFGLLQSVPRRLNCGQSLCLGEHDTVPYTESTVIRPADNRGDTSKQGACQQASQTTPAGQPGGRMGYPILLDYGVLLLLRDSGLVLALPPYITPAYTLLHSSTILYCTPHQCDHATATTLALQSLAPDTGSATFPSRSLQLSSTLSSPIPQINSPSPPSTFRTYAHCIHAGIIGRRERFLPIITVMVVA